MNMTVKKPMQKNISWLGSRLNELPTIKSTLTIYHSANVYENCCFQSYFSRSRTGQKYLGLSRSCISSLKNCEDTFISICSSIYKNLIHQHHNVQINQITTINSALELVKDQPEKTFTLRPNYFPFNLLFQRSSLLQL